MSQEVSNTGMVLRIERLLSSGLAEHWYALLRKCKHKWPALPWQPAHIEVLCEGDNPSLYQVHGQTRQPVSKQEAERSALPWHWLVPQNQVLHLTLNLPPASQADLAAMLIHEVGRHSPFAAQDISFTWRRTPVPSHPNALDVWILPLRAWDAMADQYALDKTRCVQIDCAGAQGREGINLLPKSILAARWLPHLKMVAVLGVLLGMLLAGSLWKIHDNRTNDVQKKSETIVQLEQEVAPVRALRKHYLQAIQTQRYLAQLDQKMPARGALLMQLSKCLPKNAQITRLSMREDTLSFDGEAPSPEAVVSAMACVPWLHSASLVGSVQSQTDSARQRFSVQARIGVPVSP